MKTNKELRNSAFEELRNNWSNPVLATLVYFLIAAAGSVFQIIHPALGILDTLVSIFLIAPLGFGLAIALLRFYRGEKDDCITKMFNIFHNYGEILGLTLLLIVYIFLWTLLLIIPGIIKAYSYSMAYYIKHDNPEIGAEEAICRSMEMMRGKKWKLFCLDLSFLGWILLGIITCGIGLLWVAPYMQTAHAAFYEDIKGEVIFVEE